MPRYRRAQVPGGTFFFTLVTARRKPILTTDVGRRCLREAITTVRAKRPYTTVAFVLLPDHLHSMWTLPPGDPDFSTRWRRIKELFTRAWRAANKHSSRSPVWQQRFWEHTIRDDNDLIMHADYIHYNPVKHELVKCPHEWPYSSFHRHVTLGTYGTDWACQCDGRRVKVPDFSHIEKFVRE